MNGKEMKNDDLNELKDLNVNAPSATGKLLLWKEYIYQELPYILLNIYIEEYLNKKNWRAFKKQFKWI